MKDVSVITPVFNRKNLIDNALNILCAQTLKNIEFIIIDDGSKDGSYEYLKEKTKQDKRFKILKLEKNSGPSAARNFALKKVSGKYIGFFDIDDNIPENYFEILYKNAEKSHSDIVFTSYNEVFHKKTGKISKLNDKISVLKNGALWDKLFSTNLIHKNKIDFPIGLYCADNVFVFYAFYYAKSVFVCNDVKYQYILQPDSISFDSKKVIKRKHDIFIIINKIKKFINDKKFDKKSYLESFRFFNRSLCCYSKDKDFIRKYNEMLSENVSGNVFFPGTCVWKYKIKFWTRILWHLKIMSKNKYNENILIDKIKNSGLFDEEYYIKTYSCKTKPIKHYLRYGWKKGYNPSQKIDNDAYLENENVKNMSCLQHFIEFGCDNGNFLYKNKKCQNS